MLKTPVLLASATVQATSPILDPFPSAQQRNCPHLTAYLFLDPLPLFSHAWCLAALSFYSVPYRHACYARLLHGSGLLRHLSPSAGCRRSSSCSPCSPCTLQRQLVALNQEKQLMESQFTRLMSKGVLKTGEDRRTKLDLERGLEQVGKQISSLRTEVRKREGGALNPKPMQDYTVLDR